MRTTDNNCGKPLSDIANGKYYDIADLKAIANIKISELPDDFLIFPDKLGKYNDDIEKSTAFSLNENILTTNNILGFVGRNKTQLTISSRFAKSDGNDYFLHYMLQKVFAINIFKFDQTKQKENIWDFLLYLFPYYLKKAYAQGLFKAYRREQYNDANVKGTIDIARHIRINIHFAGKIAYNTREHNYDNPITQLVRHTIEYIKLHSFGSGVLNCDSETRDIISKICFVTNANYNKNERQKVINSNLKPISHPYFTEYKMLQKICLQILRREKITFGHEKDKIYGLLFDGAWLWEEYLNTILNQYGFTHAENKTGKKRIQLFTDNYSYPRYPDFYKENFVLDAKYKNLTTSVEREDIHQIISYMYVRKAKLGGFVFPTKDKKANCESIGTLYGYRGRISLWNINIPQNKTTFENFTNEMKTQEQRTISILTKT